MPKCLECICWKDGRCGIDNTYLSGRCFIKADKYTIRMNKIIYKKNQHDYKVAMKKREEVVYDIVDDLMNKFTCLDKRLTALENKLG